MSSFRNSRNKPLKTVKSWKVPQTEHQARQFSKLQDKKSNKKLSLTKI